MHNYENNHNSRNYPSAVPIVIGWLSFLGGIVALSIFHEELVFFDNFITDWISLSLLILGILSYGTFIAYGTYIVYCGKHDSLCEEHDDDQPQDMSIDDQLAKKENELIKEVDELLRTGDINNENIEGVNEKLKSLEECLMSRYLLAKPSVPLGVERLGIQCKINQMTFLKNGEPSDDNGNIVEGDKIILIDGDIVREDTSEKEVTSLFKRHSEYRPENNPNSKFYGMNKSEIYATMISPE